VKKVLVADDKATGRELIRTILETSGHEIHEAADGAEAIAQARQIHPDVIILDIHMPVKDGFGVIAELRSDPGFAHTPIIALTASAMLGDRERAIEAGFTGYITKPIRPGVLRAEIERLLA
jgi:CheY-like chemotaxis protein